MAGLETAIHVNTNRFLLSTATHLSLLMTVCMGLSWDFQPYIIICRCKFVHCSFTSLRESEWCQQGSPSVTAAPQQSPRRQSWRYMYMTSVKDKTLRAESFQKRRKSNTSSSIHQSGDLDSTMERG